MNSFMEAISNLARNFHLQNLHFAAGFFDAWLKSLLVLALAGGICLLARRASAATRHLIWFLAMVSLPCLPLVTALLPSWEKPLWSVSTGFDPGNQISLALEFSPAVKPPEAPQAAPLSNPASPASIGHRKFAAQFNLNWLACGFALWATGALLVLIHTLGGQWGLRRFSRTARPLPGAEWTLLLHEVRATLRLRRTVKLLQSPENLMPLTWGWWRPVVLLPAAAEQWPVERRRIVLLHELAHVKRWDCLTQFIAQIICALYWFNPLAWLAVRQMALERERACDDLVLIAGCQASDYAGHLVHIAASFRRVPRVAAIAMARPSGLEQRVAAIVDASRARCLRPVTLLAVLVVMGVAAFSAGGCKTNIASPGANTSKRLHEQQIARLETFSALKEKQSEILAASAGEKISPEFRRFFAAATRGDFQTVTNMYESFKQRHPQYGRKGVHSIMSLRTAYWPPALEICLAYDLVLGCESEYTQLAVDDILNSIPPGSIYFGGTDPGRGLPTAFSRSQPAADPFYTLTQNALADGSYLEYLRKTYGEEKNWLNQEIAARRSDPELQTLDAEWLAAVEKFDSLPLGDADPQYQAAKQALDDLAQKRTERTQAILAGIRDRAEAQKTAGISDPSAAGTLYIPTDKDAQNCFTDYIADARKRLQNHQLKPGEEFSETNGRTEIGGQVAVMTINGLLVKTIFEKNPGREFYIEESYPLDWMYPYLEPHGLILKLDRQPMTGLPDELVQQDRAFWQPIVARMIGGWLNDDTSVRQITDFAEKVFVQHNLDGFTGDPRFVQNDYACRMFSKLRVAIAGLYAWRSEHAPTAGEQEHLAQAADLAFRQAFALCPYSSEVTSRYAGFLKLQNRPDDAALVNAVAEQFKVKTPL
jgi:beta-lactamase regulating signal transducer with metallopeptidase domain